MKKEFIEAGKIMSADNSNPTAVDALAIIKHATGKIPINQNK